MSGKDNFLIDTNVILGFLKGNEKIRDFVSNSLTTPFYCVSQISRMELLGYPNITAEEEQHIAQFLSFVKILPVNDLVCDQAIRLRRTTRLKLPDALIAATALCFDLILITCDADFINTVDLRSINPAPV